MNSYLQIEGVSKSFGDKLLFEDVTFGIFEGDKVGLIAKNGMGKTTLLRIIAGEEVADSGNIVFHNGLRIGFLHQMPDFAPEMTVIEACLFSNDSVSSAISKYELALVSGDGDAIEKAMAEMDATNAWTFEDRVRQILGQLNITNFDQHVGQLSGGQLKRVAIANMVISEPDFLILDEPTNHLDVEVIEWLEDYLKRSRATLLMVTHDRYFLDRVCTKIIEIDSCQVYSYDGNYDYYLAKREERISAQNAELAKVKNLLRTELDWMRRQPQARGTKAKYRIDAFYELDRKSKVKRDDDNVTLNVNASYIGNKIFEAKDVCKRFGDKVILDNFNYIFARYEKLGIVGSNGVGKTTFVKLLLGEEAPDSGCFDVGETVKFGYYSQKGIEFNEQEKVIDAVKKFAEVIVFDEKTKYTASQFLKLFLFSPEKQQNYIYKLSGGEKRRLYLATVLMQNPNFLILDEPTNDLDIVTLGILEEYLQAFKGCLIIISHDRFFMDRTIEHLFAFEGDGKIIDFPGNYSDFRDWKRLKATEEAKPAKEKNNWKGDRPKSNKRTYNENREFEALSKEIEDLEGEKSEIEKLLAGEVTDYEKISELSNRMGEIRDRLDEAEMRWLELSEKE